MRTAPRNGGTAHPHDRFAFRPRSPRAPSTRMSRRMDSMEVNKGIAAVLVAGIAFFLTGTIGVALVHNKPLEKSVLNIAVPESQAPAAAAKPVELPPIAPLLAKADVAQGESLAKKLCSQCHTFNEGGKAGVGPNLY